MRKLILFVLSLLLISLPAKASTGQTLNVLVLLVNYQDTQPTSLTTGAAYTDFFTLGNATALYYNQMSYSQSNVIGEAHGWYTIPYSVNGPCDENGYIAAAKDAASADGVNVAAFDHFVLGISGGISQCNGIGEGWGSLASGQSLGGTNVITDPTMSRHEFGHSIGLNHSDLGPVGGGDGLGRLPAAQLVQLNWLDAPEAASGSYTFTGVEQLTGLRALQIARGDGSRLILEYRQSLNGFYVEKDSYGFTYVYSLNASPCGGAILGSGQSYYDSTSRALLTVNSLSGLTANLTVSLNVDPPLPVPDTTPPTAPSNLVGVKAGNKVNLSWQPSTDNGCPPIVYSIYRDGNLLTTTTATAFSDTTAPRRTTVSYYVTATDPSGNISGSSNVINVRT